MNLNCFRAPISDGKLDKKTRNSNKEGSVESDSFYKHYHKEIKVNMDEIPIVLNELIDAAYNYINRDSFEKALILLQKTESVLEVIISIQLTRNIFRQLTLNHQGETDTSLTLHITTWPFVTKSKFLLFNSFPLDLACWKNASFT